MANQINGHKVEIKNDDVITVIVIDDKIELFQTDYIFGYIYGDDNLKAVTETFPNLTVTSDDGYRRHVKGEKS